jgi:hypothetical protein
MLVELIDRLDESIGAGAPVATLRAQLSVIREQVEAVEAEIQRLKAEAQKHEAEAQKQNLAGNHGKFEEGAEKLLQILFKSDRTPSLERMARHLGFSKGISEYHADALVEAGMIELAAAGPEGLMYILTRTGRAYVVENKLSE